MDIFSYTLGKKRGGGSGGGGSVRLQNKTFNANGTYKADAGYDGLGTVKVAVPEEAVLQDKTITPSASAQTVTADEGFAGLASVEVAGDSNLSAENIVEGKTIFGVVGKAVADGIKVNAGIVYDELIYGSVKKATIYGTTTQRYAFYMQAYLETVNIDSDVSAIAERTFQDCSMLSTVNMPNSITSISSFAFYNCKNLKLPSLPEQVKAIHDYAFGNCSNLALTALPPQLTRIAERAFNNCPKLAITSIPASVTSLGVEAFKNCTGLTSITFQSVPQNSSLTSVLFSGCTNLTTINVPWAEGEVANAPWGATNATINYNYTGA